MSVFSPTQAETALVNQIFAQYDPQKLGVLTGDVAVRVFGGAKLPPTVLGEIWNIADEDNKGWLSKKGASVAVRLIGWAQKGEKITQSLVNKPGPLANIDGVAIASHNTGSSLPKSPAPGIPQLTPQDKIKYDSLFQRSGPVNGLLSADKARDIFIKSNLSNDQLLQIWNLADTKDRGALDSTDFTIGMYLIQNLMSGKLPFIPTTLPPGLYQQAAGAATSTIASHSTGNSGSFSPVQSTFAPTRTPLHPQYTGQSQPLQPDHTGMSNQGRQPPRLPSRPNAAAVGSSAFGTSPFGSSLNGAVQPKWDVTPEEKASADRFFDTLDTQRRGYIDGDVAVPFMLQSNLPGDDLALIWDLTDLNGDGKLTRDGFAVAMHLIQKKLAGQELPKVLPPSLIPPSHRRNVPAASPFTPAAPFQPPAPAPVPEPVRDLLWDDTPPPSATIPQQSTGVAQHLTGPITVSQPSAFAASPPQPSKPAPTAGGPFGSQNFLEDDDDAGPSPPLHDHSAEIGNVRNQIDSTSRSLDSTKTERATLEQTSNNQAAELSSMQAQLAVIKASYDHEMNLLQSLRERFAAQAADIQKAKEELIRAESDLSAVKLEKAELEGGILRDKEEARGLNRKMNETTKEIEQLKADIEKAKKEAKQQKGLLAIARKQLSTKEAEKTKVEKELEEANAELQDVTKEREDTEAELAKAISMPLPTSPPERAQSADSVSFAAAQPLPSTPDASTPISGPKSNNPFERLAMGSGSRSQSPFLPFASTVILTPPVNGIALQEEPKEIVHDENDPFGLNQSFDDASPAQPAVQDALQSQQPEVNEASSPTKEPKRLTTPEPTSDPMSASAESELFSTPPTTATPKAISPPPSETSIPRSTTLDATAAKFPAIDDSIPGAFLTGGSSAPKRESTDLNHQLKDLEINESDSDDSDSDEDEVPLAELAKNRAPDDSTITTVTNDNTKSPEPAKAMDATTNGHVISNATTSFDDVFGLSSDPTSAAAQVPSSPAPTASALAPKAASSVADPFGIPPSSAAPASDLSAPVAGVDAFDAAMSNISPAPQSAAAQFSFDTAFDDNFDFAAASAANKPPAANVNGNATSMLPQAAGKSSFDDVFGLPGPSSTAATTTAPAPSAGPTKPSFDDIFSTGPQPSQPLAPPSHVPGQNAMAQNVSASFDDTFVNFDSTPSLNLDSSFTASVKANPPTASQPSSPKPFPIVSAPTSPERPQTASVTTASPPPRAKSPPPRVSSPKPRPSTSSSRDGNEKPKDPPHRHSKLSIRLPFGKKKKQEAPPPPPPAQFLTPPIEESGRVATPAVEDDAPQVKQLCNMGFSRTQAIEALEKHSYDLPRALNSLLGSQ